MKNNDQYISFGRIEIKILVFCLPILACLCSAHIDADMSKQTLGKVQSFFIMMKIMVFHSNMAM